MAIVQKSFNLDIVPGYTPPVIRVSEYDIGRSYEITLLNDGVEFEIPYGTTASIEGTLEDYVEYSVRVKKAIFNVDNLTIQNNKIYFDLNEHMTPCSGQVWCKIRLTKNDQPISTCGFIMEIDRAGVNVQDIPQADGFDEQLRKAIEAQLPAAISDVVTDYLEHLVDPRDIVPSAIILAAHPIGSYYWSDDPTDPTQLFGGVWTRITDVFLFAATDSQTGYQAGDNGGSKTHTLTVNEMPSHKHSLGVTASGAGSGSGSKIPYIVHPDASSFYDGDDMIAASGQGQSFNTMPPYYATYCWRRVA